MSSRWRLLALAAFLLFALINLFNALHKGGDFDVFLQAGQRVLERQPMYEGSAPGSGVIGPPFQGVFFVPLALAGRLHERAPAVLWYLINLLALGGGAWWWTRANVLTRGAARWDDAALIVPLVAIALPAETNFEHQNMNALLLAITGAGALAWSRDRSMTAGALVGLATALKAFPGLLLMMFLLRRDWRAFAAGVLTAALLSASTALWYGTGAVVPLFARWLDIGAQGGWPTRVQNQSIIAMTSRVWPAGATWLAAIVLTVLASLIVGAAMTTRPRATRDVAGPLMALALAVAVLASPIAWDHYWILMYPVLQLTYLARWPGARAGFWIAAALITALAPLTLGSHGFEVVRSWSNSTIAGLLLVGLGFVSTGDR